MLFKSERILEPEAMVSVEEVEAYDRLSLKYLTILHNGFIETVINSSPSNGKFLEVGCGTGRIATGVASHTDDIDVKGVDISENMLEVARKIAEEEQVGHKVSFEIADAKKLPFDDKTFDSVFCHNMLHHIPDPLPVLKEMSRVVKDDGAFLVRDLVRKPFLKAGMHVWGFGLTYNRLMKKEYMDSILASFSAKEFKKFVADIDLEGLIMTNQFITHHGLERVSDRKRDAVVSIPASFVKNALKQFYLS